MTTVDLRPVSPSTVASGERTALLVAAGSVSALAWVLLILPGHAHTAPSLALATSMWFVMMVAMMLPPVLPWLLMLRPGGAAGEQRRGGYRSVILFACGYFAVWLLYSVVAAAAQTALHRSGWLTHDLRVASGIGGALLVAAGLYQLSPFKQACLRHCRSPLAWFVTRWKNGPAGALKMGWSHGLVCLGCCWALMALAFAVGVMNLVWMAGLTLLLCVEKIAPGGPTLSRVAGLALIAAGIRVLV